MTYAEVRCYCDGFTFVPTPWLGNIGPVCVLQALGHTLLGHLAGVVRGTHCELVLHCCHQSQV